jgi:hypothetical protein
MNYSQIAAAVYHACCTYDQYLPALSPDVAMSWGKTFKHYKLSAEELLEGVDKAYQEHGSGYRPLPYDIAMAARAIRRERDAKTGPTPEYEERCESKFISYEEALRQVQRRTGQKALGESV